MEKYLGIDIGGKNRTWVASLAVMIDSGQPLLSELPHPASLQKIVDLCREDGFAGVAIDAQLTRSLSAENGFRKSDVLLRQWLPGNHRWVASFSSLMAVPVRGVLLAERLAPLVGTVIETHPRACLRFALSAHHHAAISAYKRPRNGHLIRQLWNAWAKRFCIEVPAESPNSHDQLDSFVAATVAWLHNNFHSAITRLPADIDETGYGPFYVVNREHDAAPQSRKNRRIGVAKR